MRLILSLGIIALAALAGCSAGESRHADQPSAKAASTPAGKAAAAPTQTAHLCVIDVRTDAEWAEDHVAGAIHLPLDLVREKVGAVVPDQQTAIAVYCAHGGRAGRAAEILKALGYTHVENLGGLDDAKKKLSNAGATP